MSGFSPPVQAHGFKKVRHTTGVFFQGLGL